MWWRAGDFSFGRKLRTVHSRLTILKNVYNTFIMLVDFSWSCDGGLETAVFGRKLQRVHFSNSEKHIQYFHTVDGLSCFQFGKAMFDMESHHVEVFHICFNKSTYYSMLCRNENSEDIPASCQMLSKSQEKNANNPQGDPYFC